VSLPDFLRRLAAATNAHDVDGIVACFAEDYTNLTPCHPARGFRGTEQVRRNWTAILAGVPDLVAEVVAWTVDDDSVWSEWEMRGTRRDGVRHLMRGVMVFTVRDGLAQVVRFYLEPVDQEMVDADGAVAAAIGGTP
jgi:ketosteroid isomerase-like protein